MDSELIFRVVNGSRFYDFKERIRNQVIATGEAPTSTKKGPTKGPTLSDFYPLGCVKPL